MKTNSGYPCVGVRITPVPEYVRLSTTEFNISNSFKKLRLTELTELLISKSEEEINGTEDVVGNFAKKEMESLLAKLKETTKSLQDVMKMAEETERRPFSNFVMGMKGRDFERRLDEFLAKIAKEDRSVCGTPLFLEKMVGKIEEEFKESVRVCKTNLKNLQQQRNTGDLI